MIVVRRLSIRVAAGRRGDALLLARSCGEELATRIAGAEALAPAAKVRMEGGGRPTVLLARGIAASAGAALQRKEG